MFRKLALATAMTLTLSIAHATTPETNFWLGADYAYSETLPRIKPADQVAADLKDVPRGSPKQEIRRVSEVLGLDPGLMDAIAKIESDFNPKERTGSYIGLFQLSAHEFDRYGPTAGNIRDARDNAIAAAAKLEDEAILFKINTHRIPSDADLYLIHQQGLQGAAEHLAEPDRTAWRSMCATDEGREKGEHWCKKAIWGNTLPAIKRTFKTVDALTSGSFIQMWQDRVEQFLRLNPPQTVCNPTTRHGPIDLASLGTIADALIDHAVHGDDALASEKPRHRHVAEAHRHHRHRYAMHHHRRYAA